MLGPVVVALAWFAPSRAAFAACLVTAFLSDFLDGVIARRLGVATERLRRFDSAADSIFYVGALIAAWHLHADALRPYFVPFLVLMAIEAARYVFDLVKFGREASYHMLSSKVWGVCLLVGFFSVLVLGEGGWPVALAIFAGILADIEGLAISIILRRCRADVASFVHALRLESADEAERMDGPAR